MKTRVISALIMLPLLILLVLGGVPLYIGEFILCSIALYEFYKAFEHINIKPIMSIGYAFAVLVMFINFLGLEYVYIDMTLFLLFIASIVFVLMQKNNVLDLAITFSGVLYIVLFLNCIISISERLHKGNILVWLVFIIAFATDVCAYFIGKNFGKHKLIPKVSPKKTIEGSIGGIVGSLVLCLIFSLVFKLNLLHISIIALVGSVVAQLGDLIASSLKRYVGIKDYGNLIPGHGGVLDRFDSVILVAPFIYYILVILMY